MSTLADMITRIGTEMARPDLSAGAATFIRNAINTAITDYQNNRFRFNEATNAAPLIFNTVAQQSVYTSADAAWISTMYFVDYMQVAVGNIWSNVEKRRPVDIHSAIPVNNTALSFPSEYAYEGGAFILYPVPDRVYQIRVGGHFNIAAPASDTEANNPWMNDAEWLIRSRAKFELAVHVTRNDELARRMTPNEMNDGKPPGAAYQAFSSLKSSANRMVGRGKVRAMRF